MTTTDIVIVGGGIMGISIARELNARLPDAHITLIEKEPTVACHASGRNSGVLHAGFYYTADSLKARFTAEGNRLLTDYCLEHGLAIDRCGKIVVARNENELKGIFELKQRGDRNGVKLDVIDEKDLAEMEPNAKTFSKALYSPATSVVKPKEVVAHLASDLQGKKVNIVCNEKFIKREGASTISTNRQKIQYKH
ncbi:MAG: FAD-dependent oxidoreductase, partial [Planctomycetes bacterium]|nr:FAD-dependent oxidoreductase [Planctomycetota bacterium]